MTHINTYTGHAEAAQELAKLWDQGKTISELAPSLRPPTFDDAYKVQELFLKARNEGIAGYKLGRSSRKAMAAGKLTTPLFAPIPTSGVLETGAEIELALEPAPVFEVEVACMLAGDITPETPLDEVASLVSGYRLAVEVVQSRFTDRTAVALPEFTADLIGFRALVVGSEVTRPMFEAETVNASFEHEGQKIASALSGDAAVEPLYALSLFLGEAQKRNLPLRRGMIISTGSITAPIESSSAGEFTARLEDAETRVRLRFSS